MQQAVPAHTGGVDLRDDVKGTLDTDAVPAHTGGVDLRKYCLNKSDLRACPRPHGRGGFKVT